MLAPFVALALLGATPPHELRSRAVQEVKTAFEHVGRKAPHLDAALSNAAQVLADDAARRGAAEAADPVAIAEAVSDSGGYDPNPRTLVMRGSPGEEALRALAERKDLGQEPATHFGVGAGSDGERAAIVILTVQRKLSLEPFRRSIDKAGATFPLCIQLDAALEQPELFVTRPVETVDKISFYSKRGQRSCALVTFPQQGRHTVEVLARSTRGPEVGALFFVDVGAPAKKSSHQRSDEPATLADARKAIFQRINVLRRAHGIGEFTLDSEASKIAQDYSDRMARENFFAHVAPDGTDLRARAQRAGYAYRRISENLGLARGPLAAHFGIEQSPGHLKALLEPTYSRLGLGITFQKVDGRDQAIVTEIVASPPAAIADPIEDAYRSIDRKRLELKLPPLRRDKSLEKIAGDHVKRALQLQKPTAELPDSVIHDRVFSTVQTVRSAAVDIFISDSPGEVPLSKGLRDAENNLVGVGVAKGNTSYGNNKFWVVEIYAASR